VAKPTGRPVTTVPFDRAIHTPRSNARILENLMLAGTTSQVAGARRDISRRPAGHARRERRTRRISKPRSCAWAWARATSAASWG